MRLSPRLLPLILLAADTVALAQSVPSQAYTPLSGPCPADFTLVRNAGAPGNQTLSLAEQAYISARKSQALPQAWAMYSANIERVSLSTNNTLPSYVSAILDNGADQPTLGIAVSGGGYRAATFGAGVLNVLDGRNASAAGAGLGGLMQAASYLTGLSGGSWFVTSYAQANYPLIQELVFGPSSHPPQTSAEGMSELGYGGWLSNFSFEQPSDSTTVNTLFAMELVEETEGKKDAGYKVTFADVWARQLARHFANGTTQANFYNEDVPHGAGVTWSSIVNTSGFTSYSVPFPIVVTDLYVPGLGVLSTNPIMEFNPYEMGSFDPSLAAFTLTQYLGTTNESICVTNYDQSSRVAASSSDLYNMLDNATLGYIDGPLLEAYGKLIGNTSDMLYAEWPNAFHGLGDTAVSFPAVNESYLMLVDGGENGQSVPLQPLLVKAREVDVILALDADPDTEDGWAAGSSLIATQAWASLYPTSYTFPPVPTNMSEFIAQNLSTRPTFFGCDTTPSNSSTPLLIYLANGGPPRDGSVPLMNVTTVVQSLELDELQGMLDQVWDTAVQGYPLVPSYVGESGQETEVLVDPEWPACLACAVVERARTRAGYAREGVCERCFERYCWDGSTVGSE